MTDVDDRSARRRKLIAGIVVAAFAAVLIAIVAVRSAGEKVLNENGDTLVLVGKDTEASDKADVDAFLAEVGGCLGITVDGGATTQLVVWPHGTTIDTPVPLRITVDGDTYAVGQGINLSGASTPALEPSSYFYDKVPEACRTAKVFVADNG